jgi:hypothetical protein
MDSPCAASIFAQVLYLQGRSQCSCFIFKVCATMAARHAAQVDREMSPAQWIGVLRADAALHGSWKVHLVVVCIAALYHKLYNRNYIIDLSLVVVSYQIDCYLSFWIHSHY